MTLEKIGMGEGTPLLSFSEIEVYGSKSKIDEVLPDIYNIIKSGTENEEDISRVYDDADIISFTEADATRVLGITGVVLNNYSSFLLQSVITKDIPQHYSMGDKVYIISNRNEDNMYTTKHIVVHEGKYYTMAQYITLTHEASKDE